MERLTIKYDGLFVPKKICTTDRFGEADNCDPCDSVCDEDCKNCVIQECFTYLGEYEDIGLTPPEIMKMKERDMPKKIELNAGVPTCPVCGRRIVKCYDFCPDCGQRLEQ